MDELKYGARDKRGYYVPHERVEIAPFYTWRPSLLKILKWIPHYFLPWNLFFALTAVAYWQWLVPDREILQTLNWVWPLTLLVANMAILFVVYGAFELHMYMRRGQGTRFKFNAKFPSDHKSDAFLFKSQNIDNSLRTFLVSIPAWTVVEVFVLWMFANGYVPWLTFAENPWTLALVALAVPIIHEGHFYFIHRLIHTPFLYKHIHSIHHNSVNPSPWSSLSMHPIEALAYFSVGIWHLILPSNPLIAIYQLNYAGVGAFVGHLGFDRVELTEDVAFASHAQTHYLHHKHFEVNYSDGLVPFDKLFGTWHDGSAEDEERMKARYRAKKERMAAKASERTSAN